MRFILFDSVIAKECHIRKGWTRHHRHGWQLFGWQLLLTVVSSASLLVTSRESRLCRLHRNESRACDRSWRLPRHHRGDCLDSVPDSYRSLGVIAGLSGTIAGLTWNFFDIMLAVFAGLIVFAISMFAVSFISVTAIVFFPAYSIYFLAPRYAPLAALLWPQPGAAVPRPSPPTETPPWSPARD